jgi:transcriptional regulator of acetoin/glycerol metabolism
VSRRQVPYRARLDAIIAAFLTEVLDATSRTLQPDATRPMAVVYRGRVPAYRELRNRTLREFEKEYVLAALRAASGNVSMAARIAGIDRKHLWRLLRRTGVRP